MWRPSERGTGHHVFGAKALVVIEGRQPSLAWRYSKTTNPAPEDVAAFERSRRPRRTPRMFLRLTLRWLSKAATFALRWRSSKKSLNSATHRNVALFELFEGRHHLVPPRARARVCAREQGNRWACRHGTAT